MKIEKLEQANFFKEKIEQAITGINAVKMVMFSHKNPDINLRIGDSGDHIPIPQYMYGHITALILAEWEKQLHEAKNALEAL